MHGSVDEFLLSNHVALEGLVPEMLQATPASFWTATLEEQGGVVERLIGLAQDWEGLRRREAFTYTKALKKAILEKGGSKWLNSELRRIEALIRANSVIEEKKPEMRGKITCVTYVRHQLEAVDAARLARRGSGGGEL